MGHLLLDVVCKQPALFPVIEQKRCQAALKVGKCPQNEDDRGIFDEFSKPAPLNERSGRN
jgi:hypothetical protein